MKIRVNDELSQYLEEKEVNHRFDNWLFHSLTNSGAINLQNSITGSQNKRNSIAQALKFANTNPRQVIKSRENSLVPKSNLEWFEDSERFFNWIAKTRHNSLNPAPESIIQNPLNLTYRELCIAHIDTINKTVIDKQLMLNTLKQEWVNRLEIGTVFSWTKGSDEQIKVKIASNEIQSFRTQRTPDIITAFNIINYQIPEHHEQLLMLLDSLEISTQEAKAASKAAKAKISQLKFRGKDGKKQLNVHISTESVKNLELLAEQYGLSKAKVVELLINEELNRKLYISEKKIAWLKGDVN